MDLAQHRYIDATRALHVSVYLYTLYIHVQTVFVRTYHLYTAHAIQHPQRITLAHIRVAIAVAMHPYRESAQYHHCTVIFVRKHQFGRHKSRSHRRSRNLSLARLHETGPRGKHVTDKHMLRYATRRRQQDASMSATSCLSTCCSGWMDYLRSSQSSGPG